VLITVLSAVFEEGGVISGEVTWRKDLRSNDESVGGNVRTGGEWRVGSGRDGLDFVRPRGRAQENRPPFPGCLDCGAGSEVVWESGLLIVS
jgi:hypothetical protein